MRSACCRGVAPASGEISIRLPAHCINSLHDALSPLNACINQLVRPWAPFCLFSAPSRFIKPRCACYPVRSHLANEEKHEFGIHHTAGQSGDFKADSGAAFARSYQYKENSGEGTSTQDVGGWQEKNCCCSAGTLGEDQSSKE